MTQQCSDEMYHRRYRAKRRPRKRNTPQQQYPVHRFLKQPPPVCRDMRFPYEQQNQFRYSRKQSYHDP